MSYECSLLKHNIHLLLMWLLQCARLWEQTAGKLARRYAATASLWELLECIFSPFGIAIIAIYYSYYSSEHGVNLQLSLLALTCTSSHKRNADWVDQSTELFRTFFWPYKFKIQKLSCKIQVLKQFFARKSHQKKNLLRYLLWREDLVAIESKLSLSDLIVEWLSFYI